MSDLVARWCDMTVLVDTGVLYADHDYDAASDALEVVYDGNFGQSYVSDNLYGKPRA